MNGDFVQDIERIGQAESGSHEASGPSDPFCTFTYPSLHCYPGKKSLVLKSTTVPNPRVALGWLPWQWDSGGTSAVH